MAPEELQAFEKAYQEAQQGADTPEMVVTPDGIFVRGDDGVTVYDYDDEGNAIGLTQTQQFERIEATKARLGIT